MKRIEIEINLSFLFAQKNQHTTRIWPTIVVNLSGTQQQQQQQMNEMRGIGAHPTR